MELKQGLAELRKNEKRNFDQGIDLIVNLKGIDVKKDNVSTIVKIPFNIKDKKVCGFLTKKSNLVKTIFQLDFIKYKDKKLLKNLVKEFDFFIAVASLMPLMKEDEESIKQLLDNISTSVKIRVKEASIKIIAGKESMKDEQILANINALYQGIVSALPNKKENVKNIMIKYTMSKPIKVEMK
ncbi:hypothetical protein HYW75_03895 [Candidatus Pacearchaeota archaeon]|nr:hypothetical protein [Candidatus Pacearchaeota archaeon]